MLSAHARARQAKASVSRNPPMHASTPALISAPTSTNISATTGTSSTNLPSTSTAAITASSAAASSTAAASSGKTPKAGARARLQAQLGQLWAQLHRFLGPPPPDPIRIVCISDLYDAALPELPAGDILIVAGGLSSDGRPAQLQARLDCLAALASTSFEHVIIVAGASDRALSPGCDLLDTEVFHDLAERLAVRAAFHRGRTGAAAVAAADGGGGGARGSGRTGGRGNRAAIHATLAANSATATTATTANTANTTTIATNEGSGGGGSLVYLEHGGCIVTVRGRALRVWGSPTSLASNAPHGAFTVDDEPQARDLWARVPADTDVLVTNGPPRGYLDGDAGDGCAELVRALWRVRPALHVFGGLPEPPAFAATFPPTTTMTTTPSGAAVARYDAAQRAYDDDVQEMVRERCRLRCVVDEEAGGAWRCAPLPPHAAVPLPASMALHSTSAAHTVPEGVAATGLATVLVNSAGVPVVVELGKVGGG